MPLQQMPRAAHGSAQHAVGLVVVHESLGLRVPFEPLAEEHGDIADVSNREAPLPDLGREAAILPGFDAVEEVALLALWTRE